METYIKVNETLYPATINGCMSDMSWDNRETKSITLTMSYDDVVELLPHDTTWSIVQISENPDSNENDDTNEWDNSEFCISGDITDHRDGTVTIKMGKPTDLEDAYEILFGGDF